MAITWRDGIATLATIAAVLVERAYFHAWNWPMVHQLGWAIVVVALLGFVAFGFSYALDRGASTGWAVTAYLFSLVAATLTIGGLTTQNSDYLVLITITATLFWLVSVVVHAATPQSATPKHSAPMHN